MAKKRVKKTMPQLMKSDNAIIKDLRDQQWLYNPRVFAQVSGDFSTMHQRVLLGVLDHLQDRIIKSADAHKPGEQLWLPLFAEEEMNTNLEFEIDAKDLGVTPGHYPELVNALEDLLTLRMGYLRKIETKSGTKTEYTFANLFSRITMVTNESTGLRTGKIRIKMDKENVNDFLSMDKGYTDHVAKIGQMAKKQRTPRIYIYLSTFRESGRKEVDYPQFCEFLGIDDQSYLLTHDGAKPQDNPFHKYSKVKSLILEPSRLEMDQLSKDSKIDFSFTYEPLRKDGRLKGNPSHIEFTLVPGPLGIERAWRKQRHNQEQSLIMSLTTKYTDLKPYEMVELLKEVQDEWFEDFKDYAYDGVERAVEKKQPDHVAEYIVTLLSTWIKDKQLEDERKRIEQEKQYNLFTEQELQSEPEPLEPGVKAELWQQLVNEHQGAIKPVLERTEYLGLYNGAFYIFPTADDLKTLDTSPDYEVFSEKCRVALGLSKIRPAIIRKLK